MRFADYDRVVILTCDARPVMAGRARDLVAAHGARDPIAYRNGAWPIPATWAFAAGSYYHLRAFKAIVSGAAESGLGSILFVEDDVRLTPDFDAVLDAARVPDDWALLYYGAFHNWHLTAEAGPHVLRLAGSPGTHCLGIRRAAFGPLLSLPEDLPTDTNIGDRLHPTLPAYAIWPSIARQAPAESAIIAGNWSAPDSMFDARL